MLGRPGTEIPKGKSLVFGVLGDGFVSGTLWLLVTLGGADFLRGGNGSSWMRSGAWDLEVTLGLELRREEELVFGFDSGWS